MPVKRAILYSYGNDDACREIRKFIEDAGIILEIRDIDKKPLSKFELRKILGHISLTHFLNKMSDSYAKYKLDSKTPDLNEVIEMMSEDHTLIRKPIIKSNRLMTVGCDKKKISEMLQINMNGDSPVREEPKGNVKVNRYHSKKPSNDNKVQSSASK